MSRKMKVAQFERVDSEGNVKLTSEADADLIATTIQEIIDHCEKHNTDVHGILLSLVITAMDQTNTNLCAKCFPESLDECIRNVFTIIEDDSEEGHHFINKYVN